MKLNGKNILITGAAGGIGEAMALEALKRGATLHRLVRKPVSDSLGGKVWVVDLLQSDEIATFTLEFMAQYGAPDILINNAGLLTGGLLEEQAPTAIVDMLTVNLTHLILLTRLFLPEMLKKGSGKIVNNASVSAQMYFPCASTYAASKAGVLAFSECLKQELRNTGVSTLLLITPGVKTKMYDKIKDLYGGHLDVSFLASLPAGEWARRVFAAIESDQDILGPGGWSDLGLGVARHWPRLFEKIIRPKFTRK